jgi:phage repressor protein C with HTH and peptisase S24 domain
METSKMLVNQRFTEVLRLINNNGLVESNKEFCEKLNIHVQIIYDIKNNKRSVTLDMLSDLLNFYNVNPSYILNNQGEVFLSGNMSGSMSGIGENQNKTTQNNRTFPDNSQSQSQGSSNSFKSYPKPEREVKDVPFIPVEVHAGAFSDGEYSFSAIEMGTYLVPEFKGAEFYVRITGLSMQPYYLHGDILACKRFQGRLWFEWGKPHVLDTLQGSLIKRLFESKKPDHVILRSDNERYPDIDIPLSEVRNIYIVIGVIRLE